MYEVFAFLLAPLRRLFDLGDPFSLVSLLGALIFAALLHLRRRGRAGARPGIGAAVTRLRAFLRAAFPRRIWLHPSTLLDYRLFFVTAFFYATGVVELVVTSQAVEGGVLAALEHLFGARTHAPAGLVTVALVTLLDLLVFELAYWFAHWLLHRVPILWAFHKLHHSAEVLTPFTEWRQHPIELFLIPAVNAVMLGTVWGLTHHLLGADAQPISLFGFDLLQLAFVMTLLHLRHSHLWLATTGRWGRLIQSPAHHQIHHSADPRHFDKNLGLFLSVWDWAFGTLWVPETRERLVLGLGAGEGHTSLAAAWFAPLAEAGAITARALGLAPQPNEPDSEPETPIWVPLASTDPSAPTAPGSLRG